MLISIVLLILYHILPLCYVYLKSNIIYYSKLGLISVKSYSSIIRHRIIKICLILYLLIFVILLLILLITIHD